MKRITKLFQTKASSINDETKTVRFRISDNKPDRMGEIVDQKSWDLKNYLRNPIVLWGHNPDEPENVLGTAQSLDIASDGSGTDAEVKFDTDINPKAELVYNQIKAGTLNCVSVGFINHSEELEDDVPVLKDNELLEISVVPIPANPRAIALSLKEGSLSRKDAKWLVDSMRKEAELVEAQLTAETTNTKEKSMTDEQAQALIDAVGKLTEKVEAQETRIAELTERLPEPETDEQKQAREAAEAEAAKKAEEEEAARKAAEDEANKPPAKPGDDDQGGAGESDEFDPEAELTDELQAEIDAALEDVELEPAA